jgi:hypothetical protein
LYSAISYQQYTNTMTKVVGRIKQWHDFLANNRQGENIVFGVLKIIFVAQPKSAVKSTATIRPPLLLQAATQSPKHRPKLLWWWQCRKRW